MRSEPIKSPRRIGKHVGAVLDILREGGATDVQVFKTTHIAICFGLGPHRFSISMSCTPKDGDMTIVKTRQRLRRMFEDALLTQLSRPS